MKYERKTTQLQDYELLKNARLSTAGKLLWYTGVISLHSDKHGDLKHQINYLNPITWMLLPIVSLILVILFLIEEGFFDQFYTKVNKNKYSRTLSRTQALLKMLGIT